MDATPIVVAAISSIASLAAAWFNRPRPIPGAAPNPPQPQTKGSWSKVVAYLAIALALPALVLSAYSFFTYREAHNSEMKFLADRVRYASSSDKEDWKLTADFGQGQRALKRHIKFSTPFSETPEVAVSLYFYNSGAAGTDQWIDLSVESPDKTGFDLKISTNGHTDVYQVGVQWLAFGR